MQYRTSITIQPAVQHLVDALAEWLPLEVEASEVTALLEDHATGSERYQLSGAGHVLLRADVDENERESAWLQFDGNRRNISAARKVVDAFKSAYETGASSGDSDELLASFRAGLVDVEKTR